MTSLTQALLSGEIKPGLYRCVSRVARNRLCRELERAGWRCFGVDGRALHDKTALLSSFAIALHFPDYFGHNWDAFEEILNDLPASLPAGTRGVVVLYDHVDRFAVAQPGEWEIARDILAGAVAAWQQAGVPLVVLLRGARVAAQGMEAV